ncbi:MAG: hypothetical protein AB9842_07885 [Bacteroidales bacterium]
MKNVSLQEFMSMHIENRDHKLTYVQVAQELARQVSQFLPTEVTVQVSEEDGRLYFEQAHARILHPELELIISFSSYNKKYSIWCRSIDRLKNVTHYTRRQVTDQLQAPNNIGVLSLKKLQAWIQYYESYYKLLQERDTDNADKKAAFLRSLEGLPVEWFNKDIQGRILRNGIEFSFTISETYVDTRIQIHYGCGRDLETFLALADNRFGKLKEETCLAG